MTTAQTYGVKALRQILFGGEAAATPGTPVLPSTVWRGEGVLSDDSNLVNPVEDIGILMNLDRVYTSMRGGTLNLTSTPATFEQFPYLAEMGIKFLRTAVADGAGGSGKIYTYPFPTTVAQLPATYSLEAGDNALAEQAAYAFCESLHLSGKVNEAVMMDAVIKTRRVGANTLTSSTIAFDNAHHITDSANGLAGFKLGTRIKVNGTASNNGTYTITTSTAASLTVTETTATEIAGTPVMIEQAFTVVSIPAVREMMFNQCKLYINDVGGAFGGTQLAGTLRAFDFKYETGMKAIATADGRTDLDFSFVKPMRPKGTLQITFEMENGAKAELAKSRSNSARLIRVKCEGPALATAGSGYTYKTMILDAAGVYTKFNALSDDNGNDQVVAELTTAYDPTAASAGQIIVVNELAALP